MNLRKSRPRALRLGFSTFAFVAGILPAALAAQSKSTEWPTSTLDEQNLKSAPVEQLVTRIKSGALGNVDRLVIIRNGKLLVDERFPVDYREVSRGKQSNIGCGIDACRDSSALHQFNYLHPDFHPWWKGRDIHSLQSVTKSVTATLFGVAMARGELKSFDTPLLSFFKGYDLSKVDPRLRKATLADLLTMRSGIEWHEQDRPLDSTNTTMQLESSRDWIRFTLSQPMDAEPRTKWAYNSGGSALMAEVLRNITGKHVNEYANQYLFTPLGIRDFHWKITPTGHPDTEGGLYLEARDLAKIGQLYLDDGVWQGKRVLAPGFAREATSRIVDHISAAQTSPGYGYQWWRYDRNGREVWAGNGFGGQFIVILPVERIVAVTNAWNVFGAQVPGALGPLIEALINASAMPK
jgi:hypothetical protein